MGIVEGELDTKGGVVVRTWVRACARVCVCGRRTAIQLLYLSIKVNGSGNTDNNKMFTR